MVLQIPLLARPFLGNMHEAIGVHNLGAGNLNRQSLLPLRELVTCVVGKREQPVGAGLQLGRNRRYLFEGGGVDSKEILQRRLGEQPRFVLSNRLSRPRLRHRVAESEYAALVRYEHLILFRPLGHVSFEPNEANDPVGFFEIAPHQFPVLFSAGRLPDEAVLLVRLTLQIGQGLPRFRQLDAATLERFRGQRARVQATGLDRR